jgi:ABC-type Mn2+/Zn2+ transport system permease subunit
VGLVISTAFDLPTGPAIVWALVALAGGWYALTPTAVTEPSRAGA